MHSSTYQFVPALIAFQQTVTDTKMLGEPWKLIAKEASRSEYFIQAYQWNV